MWTCAGTTPIVLESAATVFSLPTRRMAVDFDFFGTARRSHLLDGQGAPECLLVYDGTAMA